jgi:hypothetical protein
MTKTLRRRVETLSPRELSTARLEKLPRDPGMSVWPEQWQVFRLFTNKRVPWLYLPDVLREIQPWPWCTPERMVDLAVRIKFGGKAFRVTYEPDPKPDSL